MGKVKDMVTGVMCDYGVDDEKAKRILEEEWALDALKNKEDEKWSETRKQMSKRAKKFFNILRGGTNEDR